MRTSKRVGCNRQGCPAAKGGKNQIDWPYQRYGQAEKPKTRARLSGSESGFEALTKCMSIMSS
jgi:hypothetical protein